MKIFYAITLLVVVLFNCPSQAQIDLQNGLVGYYPFSGNAGDSSGNLNHGTVNDAFLSQDRCGNSVKAYSFDGTDDYISIPHVDFLNSNYSFSLWTKLTALPSNGNSSVLLSIGGSGGDQQIAVTNNYNAWTGWSLIGYNTGGSVQSPRVNELPSLNIWYHVIGIRDNSNLYLYINGQLIDQYTSGGIAFYSNSPQAHIGARSPLGQYFNGSIDDLRIYNRVLNASEIAKLNDLVPTFSNAGADQFKCLNETVLVGNTPIIGTGIWTVTSGTAIFDDKNDPQTHVSGLSEGNNILTWTIENSCKSTDNVLIDVDLASNLGNGLIGNYPFNNNSIDISGNSFNGTVNGSLLTTDRFGNSNNAFLFDGINDNIDLPASGYLNSNYSYSLWVKPTSIPTNGNSNVLVSIGGISGDQQLALTNNYNSWTGWSLIGYNTGGGVQNPRVTDLPTVDLWYHVVGVRDNSKLYLYVNGQLVDSFATGGDASYSSSIAKIGSRYNSTQFFKGVIDNVKIYNRDLSSCEVLELYEEETVTGMNEPFSNEIVNIFPNPSSNGIFEIEGNNLNESGQVVVVNSLGQQIFSGNIDQGHEIDLSSLTSGLYIIKLRINDKDFSQRVIIK